jgi:hypothetical protein
MSKKQAPVKEGRGNIRLLQRYPWQYNGRGEGRLVGIAAEFQSKA